MSAGSFPPVQKRLGQNFLIDPNIVRKIMSLAAIRPDETVLEIGPGRGAMTGALSRAARRVVAVEIDPLLHRYLLERRHEWANVDLICGDAMSYAWESLPQGTVVVANLPYYLSTPLLFRLLDQRTRFARLVLMLQAEVADRLAAAPGSADYGVLSVMAQYAADVTKAFRVSANCFRPKPEVESTVVLLKTRAGPGLTAQEEARFEALVKAAFAHRRKTLVNSLKDEGYDPRRIAALLEQGQLPPAVRAETLPLATFVEMARQVSD